ncbi:hypothetical protein RhiirA4_414123 [Rhizophagus irregularis]|uniref:Uncharacterized protein n=1 Tax=Rhizophagus irregularis TaxID=588596 RepID=A0A2I1FVM1_9GLOM|nr:hypothetical protein RhiirA4_414123 [Rhizophagus irregularis]
MELLSIPYAFGTCTESHSHKCVEFGQLFAIFYQLKNDSPITLHTELDEYQEHLLYYLAHQTRKVYLNAQLNANLLELDEKGAFIFVDYRMKVLPKSARETKEQFFGKKGWTLHSVLVYTRKEDSLELDIQAHGHWSPRCLNLEKRETNYLAFQTGLSDHGQLLESMLVSRMSIDSVRIICDNLQTKQLIQYANIGIQDIDTNKKDLVKELEIELAKDTLAKIPGLDNTNYLSSHDPCSKIQLRTRSKLAIFVLACGWALKSAQKYGVANVFLRKCGTFYKNI